MSLTAAETEILNSLPENLKEFAELQINKKVQNYSSNELKSKSGKIIIQYYKDTNTKNVDSKILAAQRDELISAFKGANRDLTIEEAEKAFKMGVAGESGPYFGGCYKSYIQFLNYYRTRPERERSIKMFSEKLGTNKTADKPLISDEERLKINKQGALKCFTEYKKYKSKRMPMFASITFTFLENQGILILSKDEKNEIKTEAEQEYVADLQAKKLSRRISQNTYEQCLLSMAGNPSVKALARKTALYRYFDSLINQGIELETILQQNNNR